MEETDGVAPVGHRACGVSSRCSIEFLGGFLVPEGVEKRDPFLEFCLCFGGAGGCKRNPPDRARRASFLVVGVFRLGEGLLGRKYEEKTTCKRPSSCRHAFLTRATVRQQLHSPNGKSSDQLGSSQKSPTRPADLITACNSSRERGLQDRLRGSAY